MHDVAYIVVKDRLSILEHQRIAGAKAALREHDALFGSVGENHVGGDAERFILYVGRSSLGNARQRPIINKLGASARQTGPNGRNLDRLLADKPLSMGPLSEDPTNYFVGICIETSAMAEQNTLRLPQVDFSDCRLRLLPLKE